MKSLVPFGTGFENISIVDKNFTQPIECKALMSNEVIEGFRIFMGSLFFLLLLILTAKFIWSCYMCYIKKGSKKEKLSFLLTLFSCWLVTLSLASSYVLHFLDYKYTKDEFVYAETVLFVVNASLFRMTSVCFFWFWSFRANDGEFKVNLSLIGFTLFSILLILANILWAFDLDINMVSNIFSCLLLIGLFCGVIFRITISLQLVEVSTRSRVRKSSVASYTAIMSLMTVRDLLLLALLVIFGIMFKSKGYDFLFQRDIFVSVIIFCLTFYCPLLLFAFSLQADFSLESNLRRKDEGSLLLTSFTEQAESRSYEKRGLLLDDELENNPVDEVEIKKGTFPGFLSQISWYFKARYKNISLSVILAFLCIFVFLWGCIDACKTEASVIGVSLLISRGSAKVIMVTIAGVLITILPYWQTKLTQLHLALFLPLERNIEIHKLFALIVSFFAVLHTCGHVNNLIFFEKHHFHVLTVTSSKQLYLPVISGVIMLICLAFLVGLGLYRRKLKNHESFILPHKICALIFIVCLIIHGMGKILSFPYAWAALSLPLLLLILDWVIRFKNRFNCSTADYKFTIICDKEKSSYIKLEFKKLFKYEPGQFAYLRCGHVSLLQWHPFSISSGGHEHLQFLIGIQSQYSWTEDLRKTLESCVALNTEYPVINIDGPFSSPAYRAIHSNKVILMATGIGITPMISLLKHKYQCSGEKQRKYLKLIWSSPSEHQINDALCEVRHIMKDEQKLKSDLFFHCTQPVNNNEIKEIQTKMTTIHNEIQNIQLDLKFLKSERDKLSNTDKAGSDSDTKKLVTNGLSSKNQKAEDLDEIKSCVSINKCEASSPDGVKKKDPLIQQGRPDIHKILLKIAKTMKGTIHIFICGNPMVAPTQQAVTIINSIQNNVRYVVHTENF